MVVDDEDVWHAQMVAARPDIAIRASPSMEVVAPSDVRPVGGRYVWVPVTSNS
jgi:hypothetical protein